MEKTSKASYAYYNPGSYEETKENNTKDDEYPSETEWNMIRNITEFHFVTVNNQINAERQF